MKKYYLSFAFILTAVICFAQNYEFGIVHIVNYDFKVVAIPDFDSSGNTDISDIGFTLMLPAGTADITNVVGQLSGRAWSASEFDAAFLTGQGLGDGTRDAWAFNLPPGQTLLAHTNGQQIDMVTFTVSNTPASGIISLLANSDPIAAGAGGVLNSFYNANIDNTTTQDYFSTIAAGLGSFDFATLSDPEVIPEEGLKIFPNPASEYLNIQSSVTIKEVSLYNMIGELVFSKGAVLQLEVSSLASGLYFLEILDVNDRKAIRKLVIDR
ncbi:MAG: T9SS type A sorting domain-containing protein [Bacteroidia bacterium]|nr:T9SS type A sorting domain-containing protein [Bacteroidia bacterium]NNL81066.1 T9SS type A sorting domain-containing protein [Flavobacteriaceae bacterium]